MEQLFTSIYTEFNITSYLLCTAGSLLLGVLLAMVHGKINKTTPNFLLTLVALPAVIQTVLMLVNGNLGTGVAIMGAFGLLRFRSMQCKPEEMISLFTAFAIGLATSAGYLGIAAVFVIIMAILMFGFSSLTHGAFNLQHKELKITVPESVNFSTEFDDLFEKYTSSHEMVGVKTTNMGSLYRLTYDVVLRNSNDSQDFINELRMRNGNLEIALGIFPENVE